MLFHIHFVYNCLFGIQFLRFFFFDCAESFLQYVDVFPHLLQFLGQTKAKGTNNGQLFFFKFELLSIVIYLFLQYNHLY